MKGQLARVSQNLRCSQLQPSRPGMMCLCLALVSSECVCVVRSGTCSYVFVINFHCCWLSSPALHC